MEDYQDDERDLMNDLLAFRGIVTNLAQTPAKSQEEMNAAYQNIRPALKKTMRGIDPPEQYDPSFIEASMVYTSQIGPRIAEYRQAKQSATGLTAAETDRTRKPFDPTNPVDAQFLDANGRPSFNNENYKAFLKTRGVSDDYIKTLSQESDNDIIGLMSQMTPDQQSGVVNMLATIAANHDRMEAERSQKDPRVLTNTTRSGIQKDVKGAQLAIQRLDEIKAITKREFLETPEKAFNDVRTIKNRYGVTDAEANALIKERAFWKQKVQAFFSAEVNRLSGASVGEEEFKRRATEILNANMAPEEFDGMLESTRHDITAISDINNGMLERNRVLDPEEFEALKKDRLKGIPGNKVSAYDNLRNTEIYANLGTKYQAGELRDNDLLSAAQALTARRGETWQQLPKEEQMRRLDILKREASKNVQQSNR